MRDSLVPLLDKHFAEFDGPFQWGVRDCVRLTSSWVEKVTGRSLILDYQHWHDEESAKEAILAMGCQNLKDLVSRLLPTRALVDTRIGDIVGRETRLGFALGICTGPDAHFIDRRNGIVPYQRSRCHAAWTVE